MEKPKVVILCGGIGTRLKEETEFRPKPLVRIGNMPILWHIMKIYSHFGFNDFILCLGYKGELIKEYFINNEWMNSDFILNLRDKSIKLVGNNKPLDWNVTFVDTGLETETGARIKKIEKYIDGDFFLATYGDGVGNIDINRLIEFHKKNGKTATLTGLKPVSKYGILNLDKKNNELIIDFEEKPVMEEWISGGFFVFDKKIFDYLTEDVNCKLEREPFERLAKDKEFTVYKHDGFWACMDTFKEAEWLKKLWSSGKAPWKVWKD